MKWDMRDTDDRDEQEAYLAAGWEPFAVVTVPAAGGSMARVVYFRKQLE